jgi:hypothetical protein
MAKDCRRKRLLLHIIGVGIVGALAIAHLWTYRKGLLFKIWFPDFVTCQMSMSILVV